ncbi:MAG: sulfatase [Planctomycetales bacterium]|nr:sulfatase [Planctomycetales bacterium]
MSCDSVGVFGCPLADTSPNMDAFARTSMRFEYAHVQVGNCMPSRNVMWSGRYPHNNGVEGFYQVKPITFPVLCDLVQHAGYYTGIRHKVSHSTPYSPYSWDVNLDQDANGQPRHVKDAASYGDSTRQGIRQAQAAGKPFCLVINVADPHKPFFSEVTGGNDPHVPSQVYTADQVPVPGFLPDDPVIREELARYYSSVRRADDAVGEILRALDESQQTDNTVVFFLSDHGMPLPFAKTQLYHHSTRTPLMIRWPGVTQAGTIDSHNMLSAVDFLPTIMEILELSPPDGLDGRSFAPALRGQPLEERDFVFKEYNENSGAKRNPMRAIQTREYLYIFNPWSNGTRPMATATNGTDTYKRMKQLASTNTSIAARVELADHRVLEELYFVAEDPDCLVNLISAADFQSVADTMRQKLAAEMSRTHDPILEVFQHRTSSEELESYMSAVQAAADARRQSPRRAGGNNQRRNANRRQNQTEDE